MLGLQPFKPHLFDRRSGAEDRAHRRGPIPPSAGRTARGPQALLRSWDDRYVILAIIPLSFFFSVHCMVGSIQSFPFFDSSFRFTISATRLILVHSLIMLLAGALAPPILCFLINGLRLELLRILPAPG